MNLLTSISMPLTQSRLKEKMCASSVTHFFPSVGIRKSFGSNEVLKGINLDWRQERSSLLLVAMVPVNLPS